MCKALYKISGIYHDFALQWSHTLPMRWEIVEKLRVLLMSFKPVYSARVFSLLDISPPTDVAGISTMGTGAGPFIMESQICLPLGLPQRYLLILIFHDSYSLSSSIGARLSVPAALDLRSFDMIK
nr:hypothetical protein [Tanacetum cinerariifolium]